MINTLIALILILGITGIASAQVNVKGYYRSNGTYVQPHVRSNPDGNPYNNYSQQSNDYIKPIKPHYIDPSTNYEDSNGILIPKMVSPYNNYGN